jgi:hypothetical protein
LIDLNMVDACPAPPRKARECREERSSDTRRAWTPKAGLAERRHQVSKVVIC